MESQQQLQDSDKDTRPSLSPIDRQYASSPPQIERRIHILGTGSIGKLVAHSLAGLPNPPPITLLLHRYSLLQAWEKGRKEVTIQDGPGGAKVARGGFEVELVEEVRRQHGVIVERKKADVFDVAEGARVRPDEAAKMLQDVEKAQPAGDALTAEAGEEKQQSGPTTYYRPGGSGQGHHAYSSEPIHNLIVTTKASLTIPALLRIKHRISRSTTICFLQNGMGIVEAVNDSLFPDPETRPSYVQGILTHGVNVPPETATRDPFFAVHAGHGTIALGALPRKPSPADQDAKDEIWAPSARYLLRTLTRCPVLCAVGFTPTELLQQQLEKLAVNSVLNPLTALLDARNGSLLFNFALTRTLRLLLAETSLVIRSLPELQSIPNINTRFSASRLESLVVTVADKTKDNISSMLADVRAGRKTEIDFINGYIVRRGEEVGVSCVVNYGIMQTVVGKAMLTQREAREDVPMERR
ncbi:2-dehydropantoate 2-reductase (Ketopantoate reductase) (KPA reductase) (KPR) [Elasticomyces elasticus]|nr:2-dehydropantoate 2-reductase (Ketopantoate reductase) (KPA reductase) (KPR) [Elasticomyces elasticus]KAK4966245.1 2-dehydropantoate 2-reductase (Ketopantoate reductase) (KPA reductase) (KPR) [Elasticomyces elasticus]